MFNLVVSNAALEEFKSGSEARKAAQVFNDCEKYVEEIIEVVEDDKEKQIRMKRFIHDELLKKFRRTLTKDFKKSGYTMEIDMWKYFLEGHADIFLRQFRRLDAHDHDCMEV